MGYKKFPINCFDPFRAAGLNSLLKFTKSYMRGESGKYGEKDQSFNF